MELLGVFAKYWQPGEVKTRLAAKIGNNAAAEVHREFCRALVQRLNDLPCQKALAFTPRRRRKAFREIGDANWSLQPQIEGDLGERMRGFFVDAFSAGFTRVVVLGSDSPSVPIDFVTRAFQQLRQHQVVLGPSTDGGYYLLGMAAAGQLPPIFAEIPWGTSAVHRVTVGRLGEAGIGFAELPPWYDVDRLDDLRRLHDQLEATDRLDDALAVLKPQLAKVLRDVS